MSDNHSISLGWRGFYHPQHRLSVVFAVYFSVLGLFVPYWPLFLSANDYSGVQIGYLMALMLFTKVLSVSVWGWLADHHLPRVRAVQLGLVCALVSFTTVFWVSGFSQMFWMVLCFGFFFNAVLPQLDAMALEALGDQPQRYGRVRMWGSIGFIAVSLIGGIWLHRVGIEQLPMLIMGVVGATLLLSGLLHNHPKVNATDVSLGPKIDYKALFRRSAIWQFVLVCFFMQASFGPHNSFLSVYLHAIGYNKNEIAWLWSWAVIAEVILFLFMTRILQHVRVTTLISFALGMGVVRWLITPWASEWFGALLLLQTSHAFTFALFHAACIARVHQLFPKAQWGQGMALFTMVSYGLGGSIGTLMSGLIWSPEQPGRVFWIAVMCAAMGFLVHRILERDGILERDAQGV